jgi:hypothetical protein
MPTPRPAGSLPPHPDLLPDGALTDRLRALHDDYVEMVDMALAEGRDDLVEQLADRYPDEALALLLAGAPSAG